VGKACRKIQGFPLTLDPGRVPGFRLTRTPLRGPPGAEHPGEAKEDSSQEDNPPKCKHQKQENREQNKPHQDPNHGSRMRSPTADLTGPQGINPEKPIFHRPLSRFETCSPTETSDQVRDSLGYCILTQAVQ
jgi:hypothetical protein